MMNRRRRALVGWSCAASVFGALATTAAACSSTDASTASDAGPDRGSIIPQPDAPSWTPANLFPDLWLDGDDVVVAGGAVTQWNDRSGKENHAVTAVTDSGARRPTVVEIHGHKIVSFDGQSRLAVADTPSLQWGTDDFTFFVALRSIGLDDPNFGTIYARTTSTVPNPGVQLFMTRSPSTYLVGAEANHRITSLRSGYDDGLLHLVMLRRSGPSLELRVDGVLAGRVTTDPVSVNASDGNGTIGGAREGDKFLRADIAIILGVRASLAEADIAKVEAYVRERYGF
ncbi:LamG domain-containing protein [Pendulispora brunnea]|uniref:LamG domain-containing protein n=1 Tax=Pendulispora brunnea TaxID=2905690 RepID=A0ABZ2KA35_9BACT